MPLVEWSGDLSVEVAGIDDQHKTLIAMLNGLHDAMREGRGREEIGGIVDGLFEYAGTHFATEERYFERFGYSKAAIHKREHADFTARVREFKEGFAEGSLSLTVEVLGFMRDWLKTHIKGSDKAYSACFRSNGLS